MDGSIKEFFRLLPARLSRRIVFWVFVSVIVIETIIFFPSLRNRERELLDQLREVSAAKVGVLMQVIDADIPDPMFLKKAEKLLVHPVIVGIALYQTDGTRVGVVGETPAMPFDAAVRSPLSDFYDRENDRYEVASMGKWQRQQNILIIRHDATSVKRERYNFLFRISGLVIIISMFVTLGALIALGPIVVLPILRLRKDLVAVGEAVSQDREPPSFHSGSTRRRDELGEVISAFRRMFDQITEAIKRRKAAEEALKESFHEIEKYSRALNKELEKGREMQKNFLPGELLHLEGWETAAYFKPAKQVAGDYYDLFRLPEGQIGVVVADVCDKGVGAALFMALFRSLIRIFSGQFEMNGGLCPGSNPGFGEFNPHPTFAGVAPLHARALEAVVHTNNYVARNHGDLGMFATLFFGILDPETGELAYINAGHDPAFILHRKGGVRQELATTGPSVGVIVDAAFTCGTARLEDGEILLGYTDGVPEASSPGGGFFELARLMALLDSPADSADGLIRKIAGAVARHTGDGEQFDDITILAIRRAAAGPSVPGK